MDKIGIVRKIDELGRLVLPKQLRKRAGWSTGDSLLIYYDIEAKSVTVELYEKHTGPRCIFCEKNEVSITYNTVDVCSACLKKITTLQEKEGSKE